MILSDQDIEAALASGEIRIDPAVDPVDIRPTGVRLHLAKDLLTPVLQDDPVDLSGDRDPLFTPAEIGEEGYRLERGAFVLAASVEHVSVDPHLVCLIDGRSTLARIGLLIHCGATTFDQIQTMPRSVTFELANLGPYDLVLRAGCPVGLLMFAKLSAPVRQDPHLQYHGQSKPTAPTLGYLRRR